MKLLPALLIAIAAAACSSSNPPVSDLNSGSAKPSSSSGGGVTLGSGDDDDTADAGASPDTDAGTTDAGADAEAGLPPPPPSICHPTLALGPSTTVPGLAGAFDFAGISKDELTIAFFDSGTLKVADRSTVNSDFGEPQAVSSDVAADAIAMTADGLYFLAVSGDRKSFLPFERAARGDVFTSADASFYANLEDDLAAGETLGDATFIHDDEAILYSIFGRTDDTVHYATRVSAFASFDPNGALGWPELRAKDGLYRHVTGVEDDLQTLFFWDDVNASEQLAHTDGTASVLALDNLGAYPHAQASGSCGHVYFGSGSLFFASAK